MKTQVVLNIDEYNELLLNIKEKEKIIKELENKSYIIYADRTGRIEYIKNFPENVQKVYDNLKERDERFVEEYNNKIEKRDNTICQLKIKNKSIIDSIKIQIEQYNEQGGFARLVSKFILKDL